MKRNIISLSCLAVIFLLSSCYTSKISHGNLTVDSPTVKVNSVKNHSLIEGLIPLNKGYEAKNFVGNKTNYMTKSQITFVDGLLRFITLGIYTPSTTSFYVHENESLAK